MYGEEKSDSLIVAANLANNPQGAESVERRERGPRGNAEQPHMRRTQSRESMSQSCHACGKAAKQRKKERFTALFHLLTGRGTGERIPLPEQESGCRVDGVRWKGLRRKPEGQHSLNLHRRLHQGSYRAQPGGGTTSRNGWKTAPARHRLTGGQNRPVCAGQDPECSLRKSTFVGFSYGFRPGEASVTMRWTHWPQGWFGPM